MCILVSEMYRLECHCEGHCPDGIKNSTCTIFSIGGMCWTHVEEVLNEATQKIELEYTYGCAEEDNALLTCKSHLLKHKVSSLLSLNETSSELCDPECSQ